MVLFSFWQVSSWWVGDDGKKMTSADDDRDDDRDNNKIMTSLFMTSTVTVRPTGTGTDSLLNRSYGRHHTGK
jgi:hypothetical protein